MSRTKTLEGPGCFTAISLVSNVAYLQVRDGNPKCSMRGRLRF